MAITVLLALGAAPASAQDSGAPNIIVTAPSTTPFDLPAQLDKTRTPIGDIPRSIQVVPRDLIDQQGGTRLRDTLRNVSGLVQGGQFAFGFYDRFISRGLNVSFLTDGLPDGTSDLGGYVHSLTGVERVEVLKGPGSALFGSTEPGGSINLVHYRPQDVMSAAISEQYGSNQTTTTTVALNAPLGTSGAAARVDGEYQHSDGFRGQRNETGEVYGTLGYRSGAHDALLRVEYHHIEVRPDSIGIPFSPPAGTGLPAPVDRASRYYTPFAFADQDIRRIYFSDAWSVDDHLTLNLRSAYSDRDVDLARNAGGRLTALAGNYALTGRQLRRQSDNIHDFIVQAEPTWKFTVPVPITVVAGGEARKIDATTRRSTADLPNIANILAPVTPETRLPALSFLCNAAHSCNDADVDARFYAVYGIVQATLLPQLKVRLSARENWFRTSAEGRSAIPTNPGSEHPCTPPTTTTCPFVPGQPVIRRDELFAWDAGAVFSPIEAVSLFGGYSNNSYPIFNTEEPQSIGQVPEKGSQIEGGLRVKGADWLSLSSSLFRTTRRNVYTILLVPDPNGPGSLDEAQVFSYRVRGWESDLNLRPVSAWNIIANFTLQSPKLTEYPQTPALVGNRVPSVPKRIANLWTSYDIALPGTIGGLQLGGGLRYRSRYFGDAAQTRIVPGTTLTDLSATLLHDRWSIAGGVENLFDKDNWDYSAGTGSGAIPGRGRTFFVRLGIKAL
jgi:iron complex outermembrane receptor protein